MLYLYFDYYGRFLKVLSMKSKNSESITNSTISELFTNIKTVKSFSREEIALVDYKDQISKCSILNNDLAFHIGLFNSSMNAVISGLILSVLYSGKVDSSDLMTFITASQNVAKSLCNSFILQIL